MCTAIWKSIRGIFSKSMWPTG